VESIFFLTEVDITSKGGERQVGQNCAYNNLGRGGPSKNRGQHSRINHVLHKQLSPMGPSKPPKRGISKSQKNR